MFSGAAAAAFSAVGGVYGAGGIEDCEAVLEGQAGLGANAGGALREGVIRRTKL